MVTRPGQYLFHYLFQLFVTFQREHSGVYPHNTHNQTRQSLFQALTQLDFSSAFSGWTFAVCSEMPECILSASSAPVQLTCTVGYLCQVDSPLLMLSLSYSKQSFSHISSSLCSPQSSCNDIRSITLQYLTVNLNPTSST